MSVPSRVSRNQLIKQSWKRCLERNINPGDTPQKQVINSEYIKDLQLENEKLIHIAKPTFNKLQPYIKQSNHMASLIDQKGRIIYAIGTPEFLNFKNTNNLQIGINWDEQYRGTNAVGIALKENTPILIKGDEHFFVENHALTCAASPIYDSDGNLIGVINISSESPFFKNESVTLAQVAAESIQNKLIFEEMEYEKLITIHELNQVADKYTKPLLSLDNNEHIIRANEAAKRLFGSDCIGKEFKENTQFKYEVISDRTNKYWKSILLDPTRKQKDSRKQLYTFHNILGNCPKIKQQIELAKKAAITDLPVMLYGESGTGKEMFAQSIHVKSPRNNKPFIAVNCGAIPENLVESELFGYEAGAFTGANQKGSIGKFEAANGGTIFLDEIGDMPLRAQVTLLRVLQEKSITPVGSTKSKSINVRVIAATHRNLLEEVEAGRFRDDLYYRLKGVQLTLPSLREREDKVELAEQLLKQIHPFKELSEKAKTLISKYHWPGNIRELVNVLHTASFLADGKDIQPDDLQIQVKNTIREDSSVRTLAESEKIAIEHALEECQWNIKKAAERLDITRNRLYRKMELYGMKREKTL
ncbi:sigma-54-dependent Fis family transcriptional regulator [Scopulibacillus cellulosilyticus]|uniref:Sigma-54-dependent Fis family transcriptional regulator n=1 Tax=Scopulibacillus cellulosilyticus TaxID=2665665 RepID=A0ABW2PWD0_9BACL